MEILREKFIDVNDIDILRYDKLPRIKQRIVSVMYLRSIYENDFVY